MRSYPSLIFIPFLFLACTSEIDLDLGEKSEPSVVVEGFLTDSTEMSQWVRLTYTTSYYDKGKVPPVENAQVTVQGNGNLYNFQQNGHPDSSSYYMAPSGFQLQMGEEYDLEVDHQDSTYRASSELQPVPGIDSLHPRPDPFQSAGGGEVEDTVIQVVAHFEDLDGKGDHYMFDLYLGGELYSEEANEKVVVDDDGFQGKKVELAAQSFELSDLKENLGDTLTLAIRSVSKACDEFYEIFADQTELSGNPFAAAPPANIPTNMSGSALGFFQVSSIRTHSRVIDQKFIEEIKKFLDDLGGG